MRPSHPSQEQLDEIKVEMIATSIVIDLLERSEFEPEVWHRALQEAIRQVDELERGPVRSGESACA